MKRLFAEPLVHFLLLGAVLFAASSLLRDDDTPNDNDIVVTAGRIEHLAAMFARTWQRPPTRSELEGLINDYVREEAAYREGIAIGLDRDDTIIRRRVRQKFDFIAEDIESLTEPSDDDLAAFLEANPDRFRIEPRLTFRHIYFDPERTSDAEVFDLLATLNDDPSMDASRLGDRTLLDLSYVDVSLDEVARFFGQQFALAIAEVEPNVWHGPILSGYGVHLVIIDAVVSGRLPDLDEVRNDVRREWDSARRVRAIENFYDSLLDKYEIAIEWPNPESLGGGL